MFIRATRHDIIAWLSSYRSVYIRPQACRASQRLGSASFYTTASYQLPDIRTRDNATTKQASGSVVPPFDSFIWKLQSGLAERSLQKIMTTYRSFFAREQRRFSESYTPSPEQMEVLKGTLGMLAELGEVNTLERILDLIHTRCRIPITLDMHEDIVRRLQGQDRLSSALAWLTRMQDMASNVAPSTGMWCSFIRGTPRDRMPPQFFDAPVQSVRSSGCEINEEVCVAILETYFSNQQTLPRVEHVKSMLSQWLKSELITSYFIDNVADEFARRNAAKALPEEVGRVPSPPSRTLHSREDVHAALAKHVLYGHKRDAEIFLRTQLERGFVPNQETLAVLAQGFRSAVALNYWENALGLKARPAIWEQLIQNASTVAAAKEIYHTACARQRPTAAMLLPVLRSLCFSKSTPASSADIDEALQLLSDYVDMNPVVANSRKPAVGSYRDDDELGLYNTILRAMAGSPHHLKYLPIATSMLEEIQFRGIRTNNATRTAFIIFTIKCASTAQEGLNIYKMMKQSKDRRDMLQESGFRAILAAFVKQFPDAPETFTFCTDILKDMRHAGCTISIETFSIILRGLSRLAHQFPPGQSKQWRNIVESIRRIHNYIALEASLKPDTVLWNQLMDAYQRAGCFQEALGIWESLFVSCQFDHASISIVWDTCSYAGAYETAQRIFTKLRNRGFVFNDRNWSNWIECLCRLGKLEDAMKTLCIDMPECGAKPTVQQANVVIRMAAATNEEGLVRSRIKRYLPDLYSRI